MINIHINVRIYNGNRNNFLLAIILTLYFISKVLRIKILIDHSMLRINNIDTSFKNVTLNTFIN
jgi:hypothetical protein